MRTSWENALDSLQKTIFTVVSVLIVVPTTLLGVISYGQYRKIITTNTRTLNLNNTSQTASDTEGILKNIRNSSLSFYQNDMVRDYLLTEEPKQMEDAWYNLNQYILNQLVYEKYIYTVDFVRMDGQQYSFNSVAEEISKEVREILLAENGEAVLRTDVRVVDYGDLKSDELHGCARCVHDISDIGTPIGFQQVCLEEQELLRLLNNYRADGGEYYIMGNGDIVMSIGEGTVGMPVTFVFPELNLSEEYSSQQMKVDGAMMMTACARVRYPGWYVAKQISLSEVDGETTVVRQPLISTGILVVVLCVMTGSPLSRFVIQPLKRPESSIKHIEKDNFKWKLSEEGYQEFSLLARAFNRMSTRLDELVNRVYLAEIREKDTQIRAMQAHINPHFLYNTLNTICWMSWIEQAGETCKLIEALSKLFRVSMKDTGKATTVVAELEHIRNCIMIQECRHTDSIEFKTGAAEEVMNCETMRLVLQPPMENATVHGLEPTGEQGTIWAKIYGEQGELITSVEDDGLDTDVEELEGLLARYQKGFRGMELSNVNDRIRLCYGEGYGIQFEWREPKGLIVRVIQPFVAGGSQREGGQYD